MSADGYTRESNRLPKGAIWTLDAAYIYQDEAGLNRLLVHREVAIYRKSGKPVVNVNNGKRRKRCLQAWVGHDKKPAYARVLLYRLPEVMAAIKAKQTIIVVEGENKV